ncbi:hypothetical protein [Streptacidiphilus sp. PAMC 29251]
MPTPGPFAAAGPQSPAPVRRSTDGARFSGVAEALPVQRSVASGGGAAPLLGVPPAPAQERDLVVPLAAASPAPPMVLPVQRTPATPSVPNLISGLISPARRAEPQVTPAVAYRSSSRSGGGGAGASRNGPPPPYSPPPTAQVTPGVDEVTSRFDARKLKDAQVDELTHKLIGPLTRLLRTELRLDRERIGKLRDPRR